MFIIYFPIIIISNLVFLFTGEKVANPKFPWALCFIPNELLKNRFKNKPPSGSAYELMNGVKKGDKLYDIWAIKEPFPLADPSLLKK